jgi:DNA polymerase I-like protein with 3'-5' exonuclease and polymerase domains
MNTNYLDLEMDIAKIMAMQEASGFRFDLQSAERVQKHLSHRFEQLKRGVIKRFFGIPGKLKMPKRANKVKGIGKGCPYVEVVPFNPTSRVHIAFALEQLAVSFDKKTETGQIKIDEDILAEIAENHQNSLKARKAARRFAKLLKIQKWLGQLSEGSNAWLRKVEADGSIHHSCGLATQTGRNAHRNPNLGQVNSAPWARKLFIPHEGQVLVGVDLEGLELRCLGHFLYPYDHGSFGDVVVNGDVHQQNADRVGCSRKLVKSLTYGFIYGAGDLKLGKLMYPTMSETSQRSKGKEIRQKFLDAIPGLEPLVNAVRDKVRVAGMLRGLDGRPIFCTAEHASLNYLLQGAGACLSKAWCVQAFEDLCARFTYGTDFVQVAYVHDEIQWSVNPVIATEFVDIAEKAAIKAGAAFGHRVPITAKGDIGSNWSQTH